MSPASGGLGKGSTCEPSRCRSPGDEGVFSGAPAPVGPRCGRGAGVRLSVADREFLRGSSAGEAIRELITRGFVGGRDAGPCLFGGGRPLAGGRRRG